MLKKIYSVIGHGACIIKDGQISEVYLLSDDEINLISHFCPLTLSLPDNFKLGIFEHEKGKVVLFRYGDEFIGFPTKKENVMELIKDIEVKLNDQILSSQNG